MPQNARSQPNALERRLSRLSMIGSKSIIVKDHIRASLMKHRSDSIFSVTDSRVMIHCESSLLRHSLCNSFSLYLSHFWGHIIDLSSCNQILCLQGGPHENSFWQDKGFCFITSSFTKLTVMPMQNQSLL